MAMTMHKIPANATQSLQDRRTDSRSCLEPSEKKNVSKRAKLKTCKVCRIRFEPTKPLQVVCSPSCAYSYAWRQKVNDELKLAREERKEIKARKEKLKTRAQWIREAQTAVNAYVRLRDKDKPCISCGRHHEGQWHAGHFRSTGSSPALRFDLANIHKQCQPCNTHLHGNLIHYRSNLIDKIGLAEVERLEGPQQPSKWSIEELKVIISTYKQKAKELKRG